jgi:hypothetical protein
VPTVKIKLERTLNRSGFRAASMVVLIGRQ